MKMLVFGGTGKTGRLLVRDAVAEGHDLVLYARPESRAPTVKDHLTVRTGDIQDVAAVTDAGAGSDAVVVMLGPPGTGWSTRPNSLFLRTVRTLLRAMPAMPAGRIVMLSALGTRRSFSMCGTATRLAARSVLKDAYRDKSEAEELLRGSDLDWTIVHAAKMTGRLSRNEVISTPLEELEPLRGFPTITRHAVASFMLVAAVSNVCARQTVVLRNA